MLVQFVFLTTMRCWLFASKALGYVSSSLDYCRHICQWIVTLDSNSILHP